MWFLNRSSTECATELHEHSIYQFLLGEDGVIGEDIDSELLLLPYFSLSDSHRRQSMYSLRQLCPLPSTLSYPSTTVSIIRKWLNMNAELAGSANQLQKNALRHIRQALDAVELKFAKDSSEVLPPNAERAVLHSILTHYPLYSTLLFISSMPDEQDVKAWMYLLARIQDAFGEITYEVSLRFDTLRRTCESCPIALDILKTATVIELHGLCQRDANLQEISGFLNPTQMRKRSSGSESQPFKSDNEYRNELTLPGGIDVTVMTPADMDGEEKSQFMELMLESENDAQPLSQPELTHEQSCRQFLLKKAGMGVGIGRANRELVMANDALTPSELAVWIQYHCPELLEGDLRRIEPEERPHWFLLFLRIFRGKLDSEIELYNGGSKSSAELPNNCLVYELDKRGGCTTTLRLNTQLIKGKVPPSGSKQYYSVQPCLEIALPWPLQSLLNLILRSIEPVHRHKRSLSQVLLSFPDAHDVWVKKRIRDSRDHFAFKVTVSRMNQVFHRFASQQMASVIRDYSKGKGSVQMHYANLELPKVTPAIHQHWNPFLFAMNVSSEFDWSSETANMPTELETFHEQCGSAITLREELLPIVFERLLLPVVSSKRSEVNDWIMSSERIALFLHIRAALELAPRPVLSPYPIEQDCAWEYGILSVQDKQIHHKDDRRLLVLTPSLSELLQGYQHFAQAISPAYQKHKVPCLSVFDGQQWFPLSPAIIERLCSKYLDIIDPGSFRHTSAHQVLQEAFVPDSEFMQTELNMRLNHFQRGQHPLSQFSLCSVRQMAQVQQAMQKRLSNGQAGESLATLWSDVDYWDEQVNQWLAMFSEGKVNR